MTDTRLTPAQIQAITFRPAPPGNQGLDADQVKAFLMEVEEELVELLNERTALHEEVNRLRQRLFGGPGAVNAAAVRPEDAHVQAVRLLAKAQQTADRYVADAEDYSRRLAEDARRHRDDILADAKARAVRLLEEAHKEASAAAAVATRPGGPAREFTDDERRRLEGELAYLRTFSDVYRTHLRSYLEALVRNVEEWETAERNAVTAVQLEGPTALEN